MTTLFGLSPIDMDFAILVADRQGTNSNDQGIPAGKTMLRKLWRSENQNYCFGVTGTLDERTDELIGKLVKEELDVQKIVTRGYFPDLRKMNIKNMGKRLPDTSKISSLIMSTRFNDKPELYTCFPLGSVEKRSWTCAGSGEGKINEYMQALRILGEAKNYLHDGGPMNSGDVIRTGLEGVRRSQSQDIYSQGLDLMVITPKEIKDHYTDLEDDFGKKLKKIQNQYKTRKKRQKVIKKE